MSGRPLPESLVGALLVVLAAPGAELALLGHDVLCRSGHDLFEGEMGALQPAVLLRLAGLDPLEADAKLQPPHDSWEDLPADTESSVRPAAPVEANGGPLSERIAAGSPNSWKAESRMRSTATPSGSSTASQRSK